MRIAAALFTVFFAGSALAGSMMPAGQGPEIEFKGVWRIIGAQTAPWVTPRKLTKADAPLLEYAIEVKSGEIVGPPPLSCKDATYSDGDSYHDELFGGKLKGDKDFALAKKIALSNPGVLTVRAICNGRTFDFYFSDHAQFLLGIGDVIYTLEQPTGMNPEQYKAGYSGPSIDCANARTTGEKLICSDASLSKTDQKLSAAWRKLKQSISPESFARFQTAQRAWLAYEMKDCGGEGPAPDHDDAADNNKITECLGDAFDKRTELFSQLKTERSGALVIEPNVRFRTRPDPDTEETDITPAMSGGLQAAAFNAFIAKTLNLPKWRMDDKSLFQFDISDDMKLYAHRSYYVARFDARIVALDITTSDYVGGHDEQSTDMSLAWNLEKSGPVAFADVFATGKNWRKFVIAYCDKDLHRQTDGDGITDDLTADDMSARVSDSTNWTWSKGHATIGFLISMGGGGPESAYTVDIPYNLLKPYMKANAPVLP